MAARRYIRQRSAKTQAATRKAAKAAARPYLTGEKIRRYESPKMIAQFGRDPWPARKAAAEEYRSVLRFARVNDRSPSFDLWRHWLRKTTAGGRRRRIA